MRWAISTELKLKEDQVFENFAEAGLQLDIDKCEFSLYKDIYDCSPESVERGLENLWNTHESTLRWPQFARRGAEPKEEVLLPPKSSLSKQARASGWTLARSGNGKLRSQPKAYSGLANFVNFYRWFLRAFSELAAP
jgi:hypothetical protein